MRRTIAWPPDLTGGRCRLTADPADGTASDHGEALRQAIRLGLLDHSSANPWLPEGVGIPDQAFGALSVAGAAQLEAAVRARLASLETERRARLVSVSVSTSGATRSVQVVYEDLEQGQRRSLEVRGG